MQLEIRTPEKKTDNLTIDNKVINPPKVAAMTAAGERVLAQNSCSGPVFCALHHAVAALLPAVCFGSLLG